MMGLLLLVIQIGATAAMWYFAKQAGRNEANLWWLRAMVPEIERHPAFAQAFIRIMDALRVENRRRDPIYRWVDNYQTRRETRQAVKALMEEPPPPKVEV